MTIVRTIFVGLALVALSVPLAAQSTQPMYIYVPNGSPGNASVGVFSAFKVDPTTGALSVVPGSPFQAGGDVQSIAVDPAGRFVYVSSNPIGSSPNSLWIFSVDQTTGSLSLLAGSPFLGAGSPIIIDATGRFLYGINTNGLNAFSLDPVSGIPTQLSGSPFPSSLASILAADPSGNYLYYYNSAALWVTAATNFETGAPTQLNAVPIQALPGSDTLWIAVDPLQRFVAVNGLEVIGLNGGSIPTPSPQNPSSGTSVFDPSGRFLYVQVDYCPDPGVLNCGPAAFQVEPTTGALTLISGSNPGSAGFSVPIVDPTDSFVYALGSNPDGPGEAIYSFSMDQTTGALTPLTGSPLPMSYSALYNFAMAISFGPTGINNPVPSIASFSPASATTGGAGFKLTVNGLNFVPGARVYFGGLGRVTTYVSPTELTASILSSDIVNGGTGVVFVYNPLPAGGASESAEFPVLNPVPTLANLSTTSVVAGGSQFTLMATGSGFLPTSDVTFNGTALTTTYVNPMSLQATVTAVDIDLPGTASIAVANQPINGAGGGTSGTLTLTITPANLPPPVISQLAPDSATEGGSAFSMLITGVGFTSSSFVNFGSTNVTVTNYMTSANGTTLTVSILATSISAAGTVPVSVATAAGTSPAVTFYVDNPSPVTGGVNPPSVSAGTAALTLKVTGSNFVTGSTVLVNGSPRSTTFVSSTLLQATLFASDLSQGGTLEIAVSSPGPGGGVSSAVTFAIADYAVSPVNSTASVSSGQVAYYTFGIAPSNGAYTNPVTFSASGLPAGAVASFSPPAVTPGATSTSLMLSITTTAQSSVPPLRIPQWPVGGVPLALEEVALVCCGIGLYASRSRMRMPVPQFVLAALLLIATSLAACNNSSGSSAQQSISKGTPAGTYSVVVTATSGSDIHTVTVSLTVM